VTRFGLVSPYTVDVQQKIIDNYRAIGIDCVAEVHAVRSDNFSFAELSVDEIRAMVRDVARARPQAIVIMCTNMRGAMLAPELEAELGIVLVDSVSAFVWKALQLLRAPAAPSARWGRLFDIGAD
jgi:maleate isomerase